MIMTTYDINEQINTTNEASELGKYEKRFH